MKKLLLLMMNLTLLICLAPALKAQSISEEEIKAQIVKDWERAKVFTDEYLAAMPADKYSFKAQDSIRNFAQQMLHLAGANAFIVMNATGATPPAIFTQGLENRASAQSKDSVTYFVNSSYDYAIDAVKSLPVSKWGEIVKLFSFDVSRYALLQKAFEHQTHHRGQATIYIRTAGLKPPNEKLF